MKLETQSALACSAEVARDLLVKNPTAVFVEAPLAGADRWVFPVTLRVEAGRGAAVTHEVTVALGIPDTPTGGRFPITWSPTTHRRALPSFRGVLEVVPNGDSAWLRIGGSYMPPFGAAGKLVDTVVGHRVARQTIQGLTTFVAARLVATARRQSTPAWHPPSYPESLVDRPPLEAAQVNR